jgi:predicted cation transporter
MSEVILSFLLEINRAVLSAWPVSAICSFVLVQRIKRAAISQNVELNVIEMEVLAFTICTFNSLLWMIGLWDVPLKQAAIHTWFIATTYVATIGFIMGYAKKHNPEVYQALRTKRRQTDFDGDQTIPDMKTTDITQ